MESSIQKRSRLHGELQEAYGDWLGSSRGGSEFGNVEAARVDVSGCPDSTKAKWFAYQAAKLRLVQAYAEGPDSTSGRLLEA